MRRIIHDSFHYNSPMAMSFDRELVRALSGSRLRALKAAASVAESMGLRLYAVGGLPRDLALGRRPTDCDLVVEGSAVELAHSLADRYGGEITVHRKFGTAKWRVAKAGISLTSSLETANTPSAESELDLISARQEDYARPAQLPRVHFGTIEQDLKRRDFSINALAIRLDDGHFGEVFDPLMALHDIREGVIRVLHDGSFRDDPTRMYRAVRYEQRLQFRILSETLRLIPGACRWVDELSPHRVRQELDQILVEKRASAMLARLGRLGLLRAIHRALPGNGPAIQRLRTSSRERAVAAGGASEAEIRSRQWLLWLMDLTPLQVRSVNRRLHFDSKLVEELLATTKLRRRAMKLAKLRPSKIARELGNLPLRSVEAVSVALPPGSAKKVLREYLTHWRHVRPRTTGANLKEVGIPPGPVYRTILQELRAGWIDGTIRSTEGERLRLERYLHRLRHHAAPKSNPGRKHRAN